MAYDPSLCFLSYLDGNWLFTLPNQCQGENCTWNIYGAPIITPILPAWFNAPTTYTCDNRSHNLKWLNALDEPTLFNRYYCACGGPISVPRLAVSRANGCENRCTRPWKAAFGRRCNFISSSKSARGNFTQTDADPTNGVCINVAGEGQAFPTFDAPIDPTALTIIDGIGITSVCDGRTIFNGGSGPSLCTCDGLLPKEMFGRTVVNRNPCYLQLDEQATLAASSSASRSYAWVAAPVIGGIALVCALLLSFLFLHRKRRQRRRGGREGQEQEQQQQEENESEIPLQDLTPVTRRPPMPVRETEEGQSQTSTLDSGVGLLENEERQDVGQKGSGGVT